MTDETGKQAEKPRAAASLAATAEVEVGDQDLLVALTAKDKSHGKP